MPPKFCPSELGKPVGAMLYNTTWEVLHVGKKQKDAHWRCTRYKKQSHVHTQEGNCRWITAPQAPVSSVPFEADKTVEFF